MATSEQCTVLRLELKEWEKGFAAAHGGRKAGRDDIKADSTIAPKYKEYQRLRDELSGRGRDRRQSAKPKRKAQDDGESRESQESVSVNVAECATPSKRPTRQEAVCYESPSTIKSLLTPCTKSRVIGPTPQKDGIVLGLFDIPFSQGTPASKRRRVTLGLVDANNNMQTPRKDHQQAAAGGLQNSASSSRLSRTPMSAGKRFLLDSIVTPRRAQGGDKTPSSSAKHFATPMFLRRDAARMPALDEEADLSLTPKLWKRKPLCRSLSAMMKQRKERGQFLERPKTKPTPQPEPESEAGHDVHPDDEMELMREMDMTSSPKAKMAADVAEFAHDIELDALLEAAGSEINEAPPGEDETVVPSPPRKAWKKKGLKRQTRRVIMRPVRAKPVGETKTSSKGGKKDADGPEERASQPSDDDDDEYDGSGHDDEVDELSLEQDDFQGAKIKKKKRQAPTAKPGKEADNSNSGSNSARKVSVTAHANYRRLKIKNKNSKANGRGRFGRGRR